MLFRSVENIECHNFWSNKRHHPLLIKINQISITFSLSSYLSIFDFTPFTLLVFIGITIKEKLFEIHKTLHSFQIVVKSRHAREDNEKMGKNNSINSQLNLARGLLDCHPFWLWRRSGNWKPLSIRRILLKV